MMHRKRILEAVPVVALIVLLAASAPEAGAQAPRRETTPNDTLKSLEVLSDNRVVFRIYAPKAGEVALAGDWVAQGLGAAGNLAKDDHGLWSITVGPLPPDFYSYSFTVDGVRTIDPKNAMIKQGIASVENMFILPGREAEFEDNQPVAHGEIRIAWYRSSTLDMQRRLHRYTPPGYDGGRDCYPVLYLLHGGGDEDSGWSTIGRAGFIIDNLLAANKCKAMIVVMPNGSMPRPANPSAAAEPADLAARMAEAQERFTRELINDVIPLVEKNSRV